MRALLVLLTVLILGGCATMSEKDAAKYHFTPAQMAEKGALVRSTVNPELVRGCKFLGRVAVRDSGDNFEYAERRLRNVTGMMGGDFVLVLAGANTPELSTGEAFKCEQPKEKS